MGPASWHLPFLGHCGGKLCLETWGFGSKAKKIADALAATPHFGNAVGSYGSALRFEPGLERVLPVAPRHLIACPRRLQCRMVEDQNHTLRLRRGQKVEKVEGGQVTPGWVLQSAGKLLDAEPKKT